MRSEFPYKMEDVLPLLGIPYPRGRKAFYMKCPCCDDTKRHLNINLEEDAFRCPRCGFSGGVLDLYAFYAGTDRKGAFAQIREKVGVTAYCAASKTTIQPKPEIIKSPITDVETRHQTYSELLSLLSLASDHEANLLSRGLSGDAIHANQYRTVPMVGFRSIARHLQERGCFLEGVPGFYKDKNGSWTLRAERRGILLPARDIAGRIQSLHIRLDDDSDGKFRWLTSIGRMYGCGAGSNPHIAGKPTETILLTEGILKADIVHHLTGKTIISVQGVSALSSLGSFLDCLWAQGVRIICTAYDMDYMVNPHVQKDLLRLYTLLQNKGFLFKTLIWNPKYNGVDNWYASQAALNR